ncbi:PREDICTED: repulsive guidance molecule A-like [Priapulus caudatus]|uniref:Repulsive guidance molecule A-like n=1 Tax=Priapulus caudatus TaxID=37621 RepID=A0ABM1E3Q2_PRICU|nr:PREDICTED: repulsive guidance molecule A-like [Priapulus caudatus]
MGPVLYNVPGPGPGYHLLLLILLATTCSCLGKMSCRVDQCSLAYETSMDSERVPRGPSLSYCRILQTYAECIRATARGCRGNMYYHTTSTLVEAWNLEYNCSYIVINAPPEAVGSDADDSRRQQQHQQRESSVCDYRRLKKHKGRTNYAYCGLFGDPHLQTFSGEQQTCRVKGAWPLLDNSHLAVQVTNDDALPGLRATAITKLTVIVKRHGVCAQEKTYQAQVGSVPSSFVDGSLASGVDGAVTVETRAPNAYVVIRLRYAAITVVVQRVGSYLTFAMRMPADMLAQTSPTALDLCVNGCPADERIRASAAVPAATAAAAGGGVLSREDALEMCKRYRLTGFFFDSCVFDLMATGDVDFGAAAQVAMKSERKLTPHRKQNVEVKANATAAPEATAGAPPRGNCVNLLAVTMSMILLARGLT